MGEFEFWELMDHMRYLSDKLDNAYTRYARALPDERDLDEAIEIADEIRATLAPLREGA